MLLKGIEAEFQSVKSKKYNGRKGAFDHFFWYFANGHLVWDGKFRVETVPAGQECPRENEEFTYPYATSMGNGSSTPCF